MKIKYPSSLYHYTTINNLALILQTKKIRFSRADLVNDLEEVCIKDMPEIKKSVFISCWTGCNLESIPLWSMYANNTKGVRIELDTPIFSKSSGPHKMDDHGCDIISLNSLENFIKREKDHEWVKYLFGPISVDYNEDNCVKVLKDNKSLIVKNIGTVKSVHWKFEDEIRFLALANHDWNSTSNSFEIKDKPYYSEVQAEYLNISIDENIFHNMNITLGPGCTESEKIIVKSLIAQFTKNGSVNQSSLTSRIKL